MNREDYKKSIIEMLDHVDDAALLRRIYIILVTVLKG